MKQNLLMALLVMVVALPDVKAQSDDAMANVREKPYFVIVLTDEQARKLFEGLRPPNPKYGDNVPVFTIKDRKDNFMMQFSGYISPIMGWDVGNALSNIKFIPASIPVPAAKGNKCDYFANPLQSVLQVAVTGKPGAPNQVSGFVDVRYDGSSQGTLKMHHLYIRFMGLTVGKTTSLFCDGASAPYTVDPQGPNGSVDVGNYLLSYARDLRNGWSVGISVEVPTFDVYTGAYEERSFPELRGNEYYGTASQPVPDFPAYVQYKSNRGNRVRVSGIVRNFFYRNTVADETKHRPGWGVQLSGNLQPLRPLVLYYQMAYGEGIGNYIQDTQGLALSFIPSGDKPGDMVATPMMGWLAGCGYSFAGGVKVGAVYSEARVWNSGVYYPQYRMGQYAVTNVVYPLKPYIALGLEYLWGRHVEYGGRSAHLSRIQGMVKFSF